MINRRNGFIEADAKLEEMFGDLRLIHSIKNANMTDVYNDDDPWFKDFIPKTKLSEFLEDEGLPMEIKQHIGWLYKLPEL